MVEGRQYRAGHQPRSPCPLRRRREKHDRVRAVATVMVEIVLDDADMAEAQPVGFLGEVERFLEILFPRFLLGPHTGKELHAELHRPLPPGGRSESLAGPDAISGQIARSCAPCADTCPD